MSAFLQAMSPPPPKKSYVTGEQYIRTIAHYIRANDRRLTSHSVSSQLSSHKRSDSGSGVFSIQHLWSISAALTGTSSPTPSSSPVPKTPLVALDPHHMYYLLTRFSDLGLDVGAFEPDSELVIRQGGGLEISADDNTDAASIGSVNSIGSVSSAMSSLSLLSGWNGWSTAAQQAEQGPIEAEIKYIFKAFSRLVGIKVGPFNQRRIEGSENWPRGSMLSLSPFKSLCHLEIYDIPIKNFDGWDIIQERLESLTVQRGSIDDIVDLFADAVKNSAKRRKAIEAKRKQLKASIQLNNAIDVTSSPAAQEQVVDEVEDDSTPVLPDNAWSRLESINLSDNALTFFSAEPIMYISNCTHLDLSHNLLIVIPSTLAQLIHLQYLNVSYNMIENLTGIYQILGNVSRLDLRDNRVSNLCGLERLYELEFVDLRDNYLTDWEEIKRMTELSGIKEINVEGNPFTKQPNYRVNIFSAYREHNLDIVLDGSAPTFNERQKISVQPRTSSPKVPVAVLSRNLSADNLLRQKKGSKEKGDKKEKVKDDNSDIIKSIPLNITGKGSLRKKRNKRIVDLDAEDDASGTGTDTNTDEGASARRTKSKSKKKKSAISETPQSLSPVSSSPASPVSPTSPVDGKPRHPVLRIAEVERATSEPRKLRKPKSMKSLKTAAGASPYAAAGISVSASDDDTKSPTLASPIARGEEFRKKINNMRSEGGSAWLKVLGEVNFAKKNGGDTTGLHSSEPQLKGIVNRLLKEKREQAA
ncbi:5492_t:CDS:2 [Paraglomus occultum]|uniref:5492_t:CDS:1 n=1 Tax=Paraglomus occultum TaxID=144539 RepID=A0A9N8WDC3_9GLOM|nr:5492_t:CDS:2 [Paraglomus occultum]